eukprot:jgi/Tetstr1/426921/TSEL_017134.t1
MTPQLRRDLQWWTHVPALSNGKPIHRAVETADIHNGIHVRARYIRSAANVWADRRNRHLDNDGGQLDPVHFTELEPEWGPLSVDQNDNYCNPPLPLLPNLVH